ncbi:hypothetical protein K493DRAFT_391513 [Basidiobolus meristosporus CBS 931.73]|uniref:Uncharacterized protein n=1 Tax=Basidiobolus meristosporus CBS 931.73 TaxID=1314790 RepID=A0A1Y1WYU0_9FUNG|nr:hypothetical protein K493DRAFT_391513 [Basidiobolus meristosporus CBS 931.73]|eukprot:ORX78731.1 hypothetical protein K493DRAFT_391513 [Basidiobolus meristosporus CBS 931.73]
MWGSTSAACAERPPVPVNTAKASTHTKVASTKAAPTTTHVETTASQVESTTVHVVPTTTQAKSTTTSVAQTSTHVKPVSTKAEATSTTVSARATPSATPKPAVHAPCECSPIDESSPVYMNDFLIAFQNNGYFWDVASRSQESEHRFEYKGLNAEGQNFTAITTIQPNEPVEGGLSVSGKLYECFKNSEKTPGWNSNALIAPKCSLYTDNKLIASMELTPSQ